MRSGYAQIFDSELVLHSVISKINAGASYESIALRILGSVCSGRASEVHICLDKYLDNSLKASERELRGAVNVNYEITGPEQSIRQSGQKLIHNINFKDELARFLLREWMKAHYSAYIEGKVVYASYGGKCYQYISDEDHNVHVSQPQHLQGNHEEADTLIAFHDINATPGDIMVRASDTDVMVILISALGQLPKEIRGRRNIIMDCGNGNTRRYIDVSNIIDTLEERNLGLAKAIPGCHAFTGCDFTAAFFR